MSNLRHRFKRGARIQVGPKGKRTRDGILFDSQLEAKRYDDLRLMRNAGEVVMFLRQPKFDLPGGTKYTADFLVFWANNSVTVEDVKGQRTEVYKKAKRQVEALYPITITEISA